MKDQEGLQKRANEYKSPHSHAVNEMVPLIGDMVRLSAHKSHTRPRVYTSNEIGDGFNISYEAKTATMELKAKSALPEKEGTLNKYVYGYRPYAKNKNRTSYV